MGLKTPPLKKIDCATFRLIPSRDPPIYVFDRVSNSDEFDALYAIESMTNDRLRAEQGLLNLVPKTEWVFGNNSSYIMAPFLHLNPEGSRFSDGSFGIYYCAKSLDTALEETKFHRKKFLEQTKQKPMHLEMRLIHARLKSTLHDIRHPRLAPRGTYNKHSYSISQKLGLNLKIIGSHGILFKSVRDANDKRNDCAAVFRPKSLSNPQIGKHFIYAWDGMDIVSVYEKK